jgi:hypothetical protein
MPVMAQSLTMCELGLKTPVGRFTIYFLSRILSHIPSDRKWLLIFDNVERLESLTAYRPRANHGSVLLTSQNARLSSQTTYNIPLVSFDGLEGCTFLLKHLNRQHSSTESDDARSLCEELGGLPLAIAHVAGYMTESSVSVKDALDMLTRRREAAKIFEKKPEGATFGYKKALGFVWDIALQELDESALKLMQVLSMLNPDGVPEDMLYGDHTEPALSFLKKPQRTR